MIVRSFEVNGWRIVVHDALYQPLHELYAEVERLRATLELAQFVSHPKAKLLRRMLTIMREEVPRDPSETRYRIGNTMGPEYRHWRRVKFLQRYRLFFQYHSGQRIIAYGWVNDENTLRKAGGRSDAYTVFRKRLEQGDPPNAWTLLVREAETETKRWSPLRTESGFEAISEATKYFMPRHQLRRLIRCVGEPNAARLLGTTTTVLHGASSGKERLPSMLTHRLFAINYVVAHLLERYHPEEITPWLLAPRPVLGGRTPLGVIVHEGPQAALETAALRRVS